MKITLTPRELRRKEHQSNALKEELKIFSSEKSIEMQSSFSFGAPPAQSSATPAGGSSGQLCVQGGVTPASTKGVFGQPPTQSSGTGLFGQTSSQSSGTGLLGQTSGFGSSSGYYLDENYFRNNYPIRHNNFYFGINNQHIKKSAGTQTSDFQNYIEQKNALENNQLFGKIVENELFNIPLDFKLECMQEIIEVMKKFKAKKIGATA